MCCIQNLPEFEWLTHLIPHLKDKAREALAHIDKNITSYEVVKQHLIKSFIHSSDYYRVQFHQHNLTDKVEPRAYVSDVKTFLVTWLELLKVDIKNPNEILEMMVIDKTLELASKDLFTHIMERKVKTLEDLIDVISNFKDSKPGVSLNKIQSQQINAFHNRGRNDNRQGSRRRSYSPPKF